MRVSFRINGDPVAVEVEPRLHLADCLRDVLSLTGTHLGCEHGACGACTVIVDGAAVRACLMLTVQAEGASIVTVEGVSTDESLSPLQIAFRKVADAPLCRWREISPMIKRLGGSLVVGTAACGAFAT